MTHPKFDPTGVRTHDLQIMTVHFMSLRCLLQPLGHQWVDWKQYAADFFIVMNIIPAKFGKSNAQWQILSTQYIMAETWPKDHLCLRPPALIKRPPIQSNKNTAFHCNSPVLWDHLSSEATFFQSLEQSLRTGLTAHAIRNHVFSSQLYFRVGQKSIRIQKVSMQLTSFMQLSSAVCICSYSCSCKSYQGSRKLSLFLLWLCYCCVILLMALTMALKLHCSNDCLLWVWQWFFAARYLPQIMAFYRTVHAFVEVPWWRWLPGSTFMYCRACNFYSNLENGFEFKLLWQPWVWLWIQTFMTTLSMALNSNFYDNLE